MSEAPGQALELATRTTRAVLLAAFGLSAGINLLMLTGPLYMLQVYDRVIAARHVDTLVYLSILAAAAYALYGLLEGVRSVVGQRLGAWFERRLAGAAIAATVAAPQGGGARGVPGLRDLATVRGLLSGGALWPLLDLPWTPLFYGVVFLIHPVLGWCGIAGGLALAAIAAASELATRRPTRDAGPARMRAAGEADAAVRNADAMAAMGLLPGFLRRWERLNDRAVAPQALAGQRGAALAALAKASRLALQSIVLGLGAYLAIRGELSGGAMVASSIVIARAVAPLEQAIGAWRSLVAARSAWGRLRDLLGGHRAQAGRILLPRPRGAVSVERATFAAGNLNEPILRAVSFALGAGDSLAILGPSGAGKSTLLRLLVGSLQPQAGALRLDGAAMRDWTDADKVKYIGYLPQDVELFNASVRDNIARFTEAPDDEVVAAAKLAGAHEAILRLPEGYATLLGPGGVLLSGGQRQRIGLARALFGDPRLVVLDEPNAHLDAEGERALEEALRALKERQATVVLVAQRLSVVTQVDKVLMLRDGRVESFGPRQPLARRPDPAPETERGRLVRMPATRSAGGDD